MSLIVAISSVVNGNMYNPHDQSQRDIVANRQRFLRKNCIPIENTVLLKVGYDTDNFLRYRRVDNTNKGEGIRDGNAPVCDALITTQPGLALFLPLADCIGVVIHDPIHNILMLSHVGRHSLEQNGGFESIHYIREHFSSNPSELKVWMTPAPGRERYPLHAFNNRGFKDVMFDQLHTAGVVDKNIIDNSTDTTTDLQYFSHSEFLKGNRTVDGRYAIVAMMQLED